MGRRIYPRRANGRFAKPLSLEAQGLVKVCEHCGQIVVKPPMERDPETGFVDPFVKWPKTCPGCQEELR